MSATICPCVDDCDRCDGDGVICMSCDSSASHCECGEDDDGEEIGDYCQCPDCDGRKEMPDPDCDDCEGDGRIRSAPLGSDVGGGQ